MTPASRGSSFEDRQPDWLDADEALSRVLDAAMPLGPESVPLTESIGRALAEEVIASATLPPWDNSAMDGYAARGEDVDGASRSTPLTLSVNGVVRAGDLELPTLGPGQAIRIMTGAPIPPGADTVIRVEDTDAEAEPGRVRIFDDRDQGRHVRSAGQDMLFGESLLEPGHTVSPGSIGVLSAAGRDTVVVHRAPSVGVLSTGSELRPIDRYDEVREGRGIPESNGPMLAAMVRAIGALPIDLGIAHDDSADILQRIEAGAEADVIVTIGGASMGEADLVKRVLDEVGFEQSFWRVKMRPGSPFGFGWLPRGERRQPVFGLPGNPSSAFVTFEVFVRPFLLKLAGHRNVMRRRVRCIAAETFKTPAALTYFQRVTLTPGPDGLMASLTGPQGSGLVTGLARAHGLAVLDPASDAVKKGSPVDVILIDGGPAAVEAPMG
jgi:molybdopterin molybdotransferase